MNTENIQLYFAPMEGVAGYLYRNTYNEIFSGIDKYFAPFISTSPNGIRRLKEFKDVLPENNKGINLVPQLLSNNAKDFVSATEELAGLGYEEVNINIGCPSGTVISKGKGAGFLGDLDGLDRFFDEIFNKTYDKHNMKISVKTRVGLYDEDMWQDILEIYNRYPISELIIHPRTREDLYKKPVRYNTFEYATENTGLKLCYNGDVFTKAAYKSICERFDGINAIMLGRGILKNPCLPQMIKEDKEIEADKIFEFHDIIYERYKDYMSGEVPVLFKMKEIWLYMQESFENSEKMIKKIKKSKNLREYDRIIQEMKEEYIEKI